MDLDKATQLAKLCCDIVPKLPPRFQIVDGVKIFQATEKMVRKDISMSEFEAKILQKAGVLWVGRKPSVKVSTQKLCLSLTIPAAAKFPAEPFLQPLLAYFTVKLCGRSIDNWTAMQKIVSQKSSKIIERLVHDLMAAADRHDFAFSGVPLRIGIESLRYYDQNHWRSLFLQMSRMPEMKQETGNLIESLK